MKKVQLIFTVMFMMSFFVFTAGSVSAGPANMTYDFWVSPSFAPPSEPPFYDCARFTSDTMSLDGCGDTGPLTIIPLKPLVNLWIGRVPCGGLNLVWFGTAVDGAPSPFGANVIGTSGIGKLERTTFGAGGVENPDCVLFVPESEINPYSLNR